MRLLSQSVVALVAATLLVTCDFTYSSATVLAIRAAFTASRELALMSMVVESPCASAQIWRRRLLMTRSRAMSGEAGLANQVRGSSAVRISRRPEWAMAGL